MHDAFALPLPITVAGRLVGLLRRETMRLRFVALDSRFALLDGSRFWRLADAQEAAIRLDRALHCRRVPACVAA